MMGHREKVWREFCNEARRRGLHPEFIVPPYHPLAQADIGIAMGGGTDVAIESAAVTLIKGDLNGIVRARRLSRATK